MAPLAFIILVFFLIDPFLFQTVVALEGIIVLFTIMSVLEFLFFLIALFLLFAFAVARWNKRMGLDSELRDLHKKAMEGLLIAHPEIMRFTSRELATEGRDEVDEEYVDKQSRSFKNSWWFALVTSIIMTALVLPAVSTLPPIWGAESFEASILLVGILIVSYSLSLVYSMFVPWKLARENRYYSRAVKIPSMASSNGALYTRQSLENVLSLGLLFVFIAWALCILILVIGYSQIGGELLIPIGQALMLLALLGFVLERWQAEKVIKKITTQIRACHGKLGKSKSRSILAPRK